MTLQEVTTLAEQGNLQAMMALGQHYSEQNETDQAIKWYKMAAEHNYPPAMWRAASEYYIKGLIDSTSAMRQFYSIEDILPTFLSAHTWAISFLNQFSPDSRELCGVAIETVLKRIEETGYHAALYGYYSDRNDIALDVLTDLSKIYGIESSRTKYLRAVLYAEDDSYTNVGEIYRLLSALPQDHTYASAEKEELEDNAYAIAALVLSEYIRKGLGAPCSDINAALSVLHYVEKHIKDAETLEVVRKKINRYQPKLFGGYRYVE